MDVPSSGDVVPTRLNVCFRSSEALPCLLWFYHVSHLVNAVKAVSLGTDTTSDVVTGGPPENQHEARLRAGVRDEKGNTRPHPLLLGWACCVWPPAPQYV